VQIAEQGVGDPVDRQRAGQEHRRLDAAELSDLGGANHLAEPVEDRQSGRERPAAYQQVMHDRGHAGPDAGALDQGRVADPDAGHVGDRVDRPGRQVSRR
jgi:hypothetical protein